MRRLLRRVATNQRGSISIITAVSLPALLGFGGLAVDASLWLRAKNAVQGAADAAASSAAAAAAKNGGGACAGRILAELRAASGSWVSALRLHELTGSLAVGASVAGLRKFGFKIENLCRPKDGKIHSFYRLLLEKPPPSFHREGAGAAQPPAPKEEGTDSRQSELALPKSSPPAPRFGIPD